MKEVKCWQQMALRSECFTHFVNVAVEGGSLLPTTTTAAKVPGSAPKSRFTVGVAVD